MVLEENWAVPVSKIRAHFRSQPGMAEWNGAFYWRSCRVRVGEAGPSALGKLVIPRTLVEMTGMEEDVDAVHRQFFLRFLSAGG